jgi:hypothetical protein
MRKSFSLSSPWVAPLADMNKKATVALDAIFKIFQLTQLTNIDGKAVHESCKKKIEAQKRKI